jgi:acetylornithine/N-succinyldiaminopimelate aminotransferase
VNNPDFLNEIKRKGEKLMAAIKKLPKVKEVRGKGLMIGFDIEGESWPLLQAALDKGLLLLTSGGSTVRLLPSYMITDAEIEEGIAILGGLLGN